MTADEKRALVAALAAYAESGAIQALELRQALQIKGQYSPSSASAAATEAAARYFAKAAGMLRSVTD